MKNVKGYEGLYAITTNCDVWSYKLNKFLSTFASKTSNYLQVKLTKDGVRKHHLVHRLVALTYINNPDNLPEVDHIDNDILNNNVSNLRWITRKGNLYKSYNTMGPIRNHRVCYVYKDNKFIGLFNSVLEAARFCAEEFGLSKSSLAKYRKVKNVKIVTVN